MAEPVIPTPSLFIIRALDVALQRGAAVMIAVVKRQGKLQLKYKVTDWDSGIEFFKKQGSGDEEE